MKVQKIKKVLMAVVSITTCLVFLVGCTQPNAEVTEAPETDSEVDREIDDTTVDSSDTDALASFEEIIPVKVGVGPYPMYQQFQLAADRGIDEIFGLDIEVSQMTSTSVGYQNLLRGDIDVSTGAIADHVPVFETSPEIVSYMPVGIFVGFFYVARAEDTSSWEDLISQMSYEEAKEYQIEQMRGRTFAIIPQRKPWIISTISQLGMTEDDVDFLMFADDQKAATAFLTGEGDYYMGSLPQQTAIINEGPEYVNAGGQEIMGDAGLWYDTTLTTRSFYEEKPEAAERLAALIYAMANVFYKDPVGYSRDVVEIFKSVGTTFTVEEYIEFETVYDELLTFEDAADTYFNPDSDMYWKNGVDYQINLFVEDGSLKEDHNSEEFYGQAQELFETIRNNPELVNLIKSFE